MEQTEGSRPVIFLVQVHAYRSELRSRPSIYLVQVPAYRSELRSRLSMFLARVAAFRRVFATSVSAGASSNGSGVDEVASTEMAAPSRTHGVSFIPKPRLMTGSWRRTSTRKG